MEPNLFVIIPIILISGVLVGIAIGMLLKKQSFIPKRGLLSIRASSISGRGVFATKKISEGTVLEHCPALEVNDRDIGGELVNYVFYGNTETARLVVMGYGMLFNHSSTPNVAYYREETGLGPEMILYALRNIRKGEELFYNYGDAWWTTRQ
jgi:SET domain-containing protein